MYELMVGAQGMLVSDHTDQAENVYLWCSLRTLPVFFSIVRTGSDFKKSIKEHDGSLRSMEKRCCSKSRDSFDRTAQP